MNEFTVTYSPEQIAAYASASGDLNPIHVDPEFARRVGLPGVIAHGMLQMGLAARLADGVPLRRLQVRFAAMVQPQDRVTYSGVRQGDKIVISAVNQDGQPVLTRAFAELAPMPEADLPGAGRSQAEEA